MNLGNPLPVLVGIACMSMTCWWVSRWFPFLEVESRAHADSLPVDGLRGILASSVLFHHAYITYVFFATGQWVLPRSRFYAQLGPTAVTLFFAISGYLFWKKMLNRPESLHPKKLWLNRFHRIFPAYFAAITIAFLLTAVVSRFNLLEAPSTLIFNGLRWVALGFPCMPDLNRVPQERLTGGVYWTLRMEVLFYLCLPAFIWFRKGWRVLLLLGTVLAVDRVLRLIPAHDEMLSCAIANLDRFCVSLFSGFSIGMIAAYEPWSRRIRDCLRSHWGSVVGLSLLLVHFALIPAVHSWREPLLLAPVFFMVVTGNSFFGILSSRPLRCLGQVSYSIYIFHGLILFAITTLWNSRVDIRGEAPLTYWALIICIAVAVSLFCSLTYWYIERPFLSRRDSPGPRLS